MPLPRLQIQRGAAERGRPQKPLRPRRKSLLPLQPPVRSISLPSNDSPRPCGAGVCLGAWTDGTALFRAKVCRMRRALMIIGVVLILLGIAAVLHPTYTYHRQEQVAKIGSFQATLDEEKIAQIPVAATAAVLIPGLALVLISPTTQPSFLSHLPLS